MADVHVRRVVFDVEIGRNKTYVDGHGAVCRHIGAGGLGRLLQQ